MCLLLYFTFQESYLSNLVKESNLENADHVSSAYLGILPLKLLLLKDADPNNFSLMDKLMDHNTHREKDKAYWNACQDKVVNRIILKCNQTQFNPEEINRMIGILEVNAFEIYGNGHIGYRGLFSVVIIIFLLQL